MFYLQYLNKYFLRIFGFKVSIQFNSLESLQLKAYKRKILLTQEWINVIIYDINAERVQFVPRILNGKIASH